MEDRHRYKAGKFYDISYAFPAVQSNGSVSVNMELVSALYSSRMIRE